MEVTENTKKDLMTTLTSRRLERALARGKGGVLLVDQDGQVTSSLSGSASNDSKPLQVYLDATRSQQDAEVVALRRNALTLGDDYSIFRDYDTDEGRVTLSIHGFPVRGRADSVESVIELVQDVSEPIARAREDLSQKVADDAASTLAHEINNPLAAIVGSVELIRRHPPSTSIQKELDSILHQVLRISRSIEALGTVLSMVERGRRAAEGTRFRPSTFATDLR